ncbi:MAG: hypothetical protein H6817_04025 [Phycisphaerales bacterium]|nr:hypothetical protein [Phycisphaerales bacterium]
MSARPMTSCEMHWGYKVVAAALAISSVACDFDAAGNGHGPAPQLCQLDLEPNVPMIDDAPESGIVEGDGLYVDEDFIVRWNVCYHAANDDWGDNTGEYTSLLEIFHNGELFWVDEMDTEPLSQHSCRYDEIYVADGLPAGHYKMRLTLDPDGVVPECSGQLTHANNVTSTGFDVLPIPIDDFTVPTPDGDGGDDQLVNPNGSTGGSPQGTQAVNPSQDDPDTRDTDKFDPDARKPDPDPDDPNQIDPNGPTPPKTPDPVFQVAGSQSN